MLKLADIYIIFTYVIVGMQGLGYRSVRTGKRMLRNCQSSNLRENRPWRIQGSTAGDPEAFARVSRSRREVHPLPRLTTEIQFPIRGISVLIVEPSIGDMIYGTHAVYDLYL